MDNPFLSAISKRRSIYRLSKNLPIPKDDLISVITAAIRLAPSSYNSQSSRAVILLGGQSEKFWSLTNTALQRVISPDTFASTEAKMNSFAAGAGTVLFFEDEQTIAHLRAKYPLYSDQLAIFSAHSAGMAQFAVWSALANAGIGASLQHYNPLVDKPVALEWGIPEHWSLCAQMPFGSYEDHPPAKTYIDDGNRFMVFE